MCIFGRYSAISCAYYLASVRAFGLCLFAHFLLLAVFLAKPSSQPSNSNSKCAVGGAETCELLVVESDKRA